MSTSEERVYVPMFVANIDALYVKEGEDFKSLKDLLRQASPVEVKLPTATTTVTSVTVAGQPTEYSSTLASPMDLCCYNIPGGRVYLPCDFADILIRSME